MARSDRAGVYTARSLTAIRDVEVCHEAKSIKHSLVRALIVVWVAIANAVVAALKWSLFRGGRPPSASVRAIVAYIAGTLGDSVVTLTSLAGLRQAFPNATLTVIVNATGYDPNLSRKLFEEVRWLDNVVVLRDDPVKREGLRIAVTYPRIDKGPCDLFVNFSRFGNTGWLGAVLREIIFAKWLGASWAIGFGVNAYNRHGATLNSVKHHFVRNEPRRPSEVLAEIDLRAVEGADILPCSAAARTSVIANMGKEANGRPIFVINPGAKFKIQCWPVERFAELAVWLHREYNGYIVVTGTTSERSLGDEVLRRDREAGINLAGQTSVQELIELLRLSTACITNDTGTMHLAAELEKPTVAIFTTRMSPTNWFPKGGKVVALFSFSSSSYSYKDEGDVPCECLMQIGVADVFEGLNSVLPTPLADH